MLSVGSKSTQFILRNVEIEGNYESDVSKFHASAGELIHLSIDPDAVRTWTLSANDQTSLVDTTAYYIYAKCTKEPGYTGQIIVDETQRQFDDDPTYYYFLIGVLHSVVDGVRGVSLTYGQTIINGKFIRTGKIESTDGLTYFNLDNSEIHGKITFTAGSGGYDNIIDKPDLSVYAETTVTDDLQSQIDGKIISWFTETDPNIWSEADRAKHDGDMWYKASTHELKRYKADTNEWTLIEDQKAIDAYTNAAIAQDTADGKRRVFTATPTTPYDVGDLWAEGSDGDLKVCITARASGAYEAVDWGLASNYTSYKTFRQTTAPTSGMQAGDMWIDTDDGDKLYTYNGSIWIQAYTIINGGNIEAGSLSLVSAASDFNWGALGDDGHKPDNDADVTGNHTAADIINLPATPSGAGLYATGSYLGYYDSAAWKAYIQSNGLFYFKGDANNYIQWNGSKLNVVGDIVIKGGSGIANLTDAGALATKDEVANTDLGETIISGGYIKTDLLTADNIKTGTIDGVRFKVGGEGSSQDIYFKDSGINLYDISSNVIRFYKSGTPTFNITFNPDEIQVYSGGKLKLGTLGEDLMLSVSNVIFTFYLTGQFRLPTLSSTAPTSNNYNGEIAVDEVGNLHNYKNSAWYYVQSGSGW